VLPTSRFIYIDFLLNAKVNFLFRLDTTLWLLRKSVKANLQAFLTSEPDETQSSPLRPGLLNYQKNCSLYLLNRRTYKPHIQSRHESNDKSRRHNYEFSPVCLLTELSWFVVDRNCGRTARFLHCATMKQTYVCFTARPNMTEAELDSSARMRASKMTLVYDAL